MAKTDIILRCMYLVIVSIKAYYRLPWDYFDIINVTIMTLLPPLPAKEPENDDEREIYIITHN